MKKLLIIILLIFAVWLFIASTQVKNETEATKPATKLEAFLAKKGTLFVKDFYRLGAAHGKYGAKIELSAVVLYEPGKETERIRGLRIEVNEGGKYERSSTSFLDVDEIESLSKALEYMSGLSARWKDIKKEEYTEVIFSTKGNFNIGFYQRGSEQVAFSSIDYIGEASCFFSSMQDLNFLKTLVDSGLNLLREK